MGYAKIQIIGNVGRDPESRFTPNGKAVTEFSVAVNQGKKDQQTGEWSDESDWFRVSVWGEAAKTAAEKYHKGSKVLVDGRFRTREYTASDGTKRISLDVTADTVVALDSRPAATAAAGDGEDLF
jgi:single-strand DNA-binding protein